MNPEIFLHYAPLISAFATVATFFIWAIYAVLFYSQFRRRRASHLFIHAAGDGGPSTECLVINLSSEPVHILCSLAACGESSVQVQADDQDLSLQARVKQGPLATGDSLSLGRFDGIMAAIRRAAAEGDEQADQQEQRLEVRVAAIHGLSDRPIGAMRSFIYYPAISRVVPDMAHTEQRRSRRDSRQVRQWMRDCESYREK